MKKDIFLDRAFVYNLLGRAFQEEADEAFLTALKEMDLINNFPLQYGSEKVTLGLKTIVQFLDHMKQEDVATLRMEYASLFLGPANLKAPPWESVYRTTNSIVFGKTTLEVREAYREFGLVIEKLHKEPDDHIAMELGFMGYLCLQAVQALEKQDNEELINILLAQDSFITEHLNVWIKEFCLLVKGAEGGDFYKGFALLTEGFIDKEEQRVKNALVEKVMG